MKNKKRILELCLILMSFLVMVSCSSKYIGKKFNYSYTNEANTWIESYKYQVFYSCLKEGYQNDTIFKLMDKKDFFDFNEDINSDNRAKAIVLGKNIIKNLPKAIIPKCDDCSEKEKSEEALKKYISSNCLKYYASRELDSIAKNEYVKYLKNEKENEKN